MDHPYIDLEPIIVSLPPGEINYLSGYLSSSRVPEGGLIFQEGENGDQFHVVLSGQLELFKTNEKGEKSLLGIAGPSDYIGEVSHLDSTGLRRTASARALTDVEVLGIKFSDFDDFLQRCPQIAIEMSRKASLHLQNQGRKIFEDLRSLREKNRQLSRAYEDLKMAQAELIEKEKLEHELKLAREIQESITPRDLPYFEGFDFGAQMIPARAVGGDLFDFIPLNRDSIGILVGDVTDKGMPAAIFMALTKSLIRAAATPKLSPRGVLLKANRHLYEMNTTDMFVTVLYGVLNRRTRIFTYARAGHEVPILFDGDGHKWKPSWKTGQALGLFPSSEILIDEQIVTIPSGGTLLLFTDGVTDARNNQNEDFGAKRLEDIVLRNPSFIAQDLCKLIVRTIKEYRGEFPQDDDVTLVALHAKNG